jgi:hypothetical protein
MTGYVAAEDEDFAQDEGAFLRAEILAEITGAARNLALPATASTVVAMQHPRMRAAAASLAAKLPLEDEPVMTAPAKHSVLPDLIGGVACIVAGASILLALASISGL